MEIAIVGAAGRMGRMLVKLAGEDKDLDVVAEIDVAEGYAREWPAGTEAVIDFSFHTAVPPSVEKAAAQGIPYVIGTTGLTSVEQAVVESGGAGRFGTWTCSYGYTLSSGLAEHARNVLLGTSELCDIDAISAAYGVFSPGAEWNGSNYTTVDTGVKADNTFLIYQDTYIKGDPGHYMESTKVEVPEKYFTVK